MSVKLGKSKFFYLRYVYEVDEESGSPLCQGRLCKNFSVKTIALKVCHHKDCQSSNNGQPLLLCQDCDRVTHAGVSKTHARFEVKGNEGCEKMPSSKIAESDSGAEDDIVPAYIDKPKTKAHSSRRKFMKLSTDNSKKKPRRHNTDDPGREFIRLKIYTGTPEDFNLELIPALKGKTLKDSLEPILEKYNITFESHSVFLDSSNTPLPLAFETFPLSGSILHVRDHSNVDKRVKDISKNFESRAQPEHPVSRTPSFGKKREEREKELGTKQDEKENEETTKKGKKSGGSTPVDSEATTLTTANSNIVTNNSVKSKPAGILTGLFTANPSALMKGKDLMNTPRSLPEILQFFTVYGLEKDSKTTTSNEQQFYLENSWTEIVENCEDLSKSVRDQQEAIWELLSTEVAYINKLQVIKKIFILCLRNIQSEGYLTEVDLTNLFSNIEEIYAVNVSFWLSTLKPVMNMARHTKKLLNPFYMADGFATFDSQFEPYLKYCMEESSCTQYFKQKQSEDELFKLYVEWCENRQECKRLKLSDLLVKPMQRLTKYPLLLKAILKKTVDEGKRKEITSMISTVQKFVSKVDGTLKIRHEKENLNKAAIKIETYWPVDPISDEVEKLLIDNYCDFDLSRAIPGACEDQHRCLLYNGALRLTEKQGRMDMHAFLFTDMLLLTKPKKMDKFKIVKAPLRIDMVKVHALKDPGTFLLVYLNEYHTVVCAYVLQAPSPSVQAKWIEMIDKAKNLYRAVLQSDGCKCLTADDASMLSPEATPSQSPTMKNKPSSWKTSNDSLDVPGSSSSSSPRLRRHLSGSDGNLAVAGLTDNSRSSGVIRRASCNERKTKMKHDHQYRRPAAESKITRSTSDPHNKPAREDVLHSGRLSRSSSAKQANTITEGEMQMLPETSVDLESPRSTTSISEVDLTESVDMDEIQMSLSPESELAPGVNPTETQDKIHLSSNKGRPSANDISEKESSERLKLLLAQKLSTAASSKDSLKNDDSASSPREHAKRTARSHGERKRVPRSSSVDRARKAGERKLAMDAGLPDAAATSELKAADSRKSKLSRSSSGSRQLPDPSQISAKSRSLPRTSGNSEGNGNDEENQCNGLEITGNVSRNPKNDPGSSQDMADGSELSRGSPSAQAPPIKAPLIAGLSLTRNGSNGTDVSRKRNQLPKRSSPVLHRKSPELMRKSMDDQLLEPKSSPPLRRAKSETDTPVETLRPKSKHHSRNSEHSKNSDGKNSHNREEATSKSCENSQNFDGSSSKNSEQSAKTRPRGRRSPMEQGTARRSSAGDDAISDSRNLLKPTQDKNISNSTNSLDKDVTGNSGTSAGDKPARRQMKKYRGREHRKVIELDATNVDESLKPDVEPFVLEASEYV